jgi:hypothetical protein
MAGLRIAGIGPFMSPLIATVTIRMPDSGVLGMLTVLAALVWILMDLKDRRRPRVFLFVSAIPFYGWICNRVLATEDTLLPLKFDFVLYHIDQALGVSPAAIAGFLHSATPWPILEAVYRSLLLAMALWYAVDLRYGNGPSIIWAYAAELFAGPCLYALLPACGPVYAFPGFPHHTVQNVLETVRLSGAPNAVPSLHMATAFLLVVFARSWTWRIAGVLFAISTALATLATGEHYAIDLIIGLPFACFAAAVAHRRIGLAGVHLGLVLVWMTAIRTAAPALVRNPGALLLFAAITVASSFWAASALRVATPRARPVESPVTGLIPAESPGIR